MAAMLERVTQQHCRDRKQAERGEPIHGLPLIVFTGFATNVEAIT